MSVSDISTVLNNTITNSYVMTDITKYTKLNSILDPSVTTLDSNFGGQRLITSTNGDILFVDSGHEGGSNLFSNAGIKNGRFWTDSNGTVNTNIYGNLWMTNFTCGGGAVGNRTQVLISTNNTILTCLDLHFKLISKGPYS